MARAHLLQFRVILVALFWLFSGPARAQTQGPTIRGLVKDSSGVALPGVEVQVSSSSLIERTRTVVTDGQGSYNVADLRPGIYTATFAHDGFVTVRCHGIELTSGLGASLDIEMQSGTPVQTAEVSWQRPVIDGHGVSQRAVATRQLMDALPTDRSFISFAAMAAGMQVVGALQNVGGAIPETPLMLKMHGSRIGESRLFVDGMSVMSGNSTGGLSFGNFLNNAMIEEVVVNTDSLSPEFEVSGVTSNIVPKEGSDALHGFFSGRYTNTNLQGRNLSPDLIAGGLSSGNRIQKIWDANPAAGGPLIKERVWWFLSIRHWGSYTYIAGLYDDRDPSGLFYTPDTTRPSVYPVWHASADARLTIRATPRNKINAYYHAQHTDFGTCSMPTRLTAPSGCAQVKNDPQWFAQVSSTAQLGSRAMFEAGATITVQNSRGRSKFGASADLPSITESSTGFSWRAPSGGFGGTRNNQSNYRGAISYVAGRHAAKVGLTLLRQWRVTGSDHNNDVNYTFFNGTPNRLTQFAEPATFRERVNYDLGLYAHDQWRMSRLTLNVGVRADFLDAQVDRQKLPAGPLVPAREFAPIEHVPNWRDLSPRLGAAYDPFGRGKTAIKATLGRYVTGESYTIARLLNPLESTVSSASRTWDDAWFPLGDQRRGNFAADCDFTNLAANDECGAATPDTFGQIIVSTRYDQASIRGFGVRPFNWGASLSVQHEIFPQVSVSAGYFRRWYGNFNNVSQNLAVTNDDFTPYCIPIPVDVRLPGGGGDRLCGFYDVTASRFGKVDNLIGRARSFGRQEDVFDGIDLTFSARLPNRTIVNGGLGLGRERTNNCYVLDDRTLSFGATAPRTPAFCDIHPPLQPNLKLQTVYPLPWAKIQVAAIFQSLPGPQLLAQQTTTNSEILPWLGRSLSSCGTRVTCSATVLLDLLPPGTSYGDRVYQVDLRVSKSMALGRAQIRPMASIYNLLNANPVLSYSNRYDRSWPAPTAILAARFVDVGVQVDF